MALYIVCHHPTDNAACHFAILVSSHAVAQYKQPVLIRSISMCRINTVLHIASATDLENA